MGRTVWCDVCRQPFTSDNGLWFVTVSVNEETALGAGEVFRLDAHGDCVENLVANLREAHEYGNSNSIPEISS